MPLTCSTCQVGHPSIECFCCLAACSSTFRSHRPPNLAPLAQSLNYSSANPWKGLTSNHAQHTNFLGTQSIMHCGRVFASNAAATGKPSIGSAPLVTMLLAWLVVVEAYQPMRAEVLML